MKLDYVQIGSDDEWYLSLYVDGQFKFGGDEYHDKISYFLDGYECALRDYLQVESKTYHTVEHDDWHCIDYNPCQDLYEYLSKLGCDFKIRSEAQ